MQLSLQPQKEKKEKRKEKKEKKKEDCAYKAVIWRPTHGYTHRHDTALLLQPDRPLPATGTGTKDPATPSLVCPQPE